jgi:hypothetical protein
MAAHALKLVEEGYSNNSSNANSGLDNKLEEVLQLPEIQRARIAQFCYSRVHMREMAIRIAHTCGLQALRVAFGQGGTQFYKNTRDLDDAIAKNNELLGNKSERKITLA